MTALAGRRWLGACSLVFVLALAANVPTAGDLGLTYDEPAYRHSQMVSAQWWEQLAHVRTASDLRALLEPDALLYYWPYARHGINFHPPLAGQLNLLTVELFGRWMKDIPARRMASVIEYCVALTLLFGFLARRYDAWVGAVAAGALVCMPRVYGQAHLADTDTPGLLLWAATALAFWKGLHEPNAGLWRNMVGVLMGFAFVEKMGAVVVLLPLLLWLLAGHLVLRLRQLTWADWVDGLVSTAAVLAPLGFVYLEIHRLARRLPAPAYTNLFIHRPATAIPGVILAAPLLIWIVRRLLAARFASHPVLGERRPALETWTGILAFAPLVGWLGNPAWWRETIPRLSHYYELSTARRGALPDIQILYFGQVYEYSLPWPNAWVLIGITVPVSILAAALAGLVWSVLRIKRDRLPLYFLLHLVTLPILRMLPTPGHDGVRLFLPTFFFLAAFAGWGTVALAVALAGQLRVARSWVCSVVAALVLAPAACSLVAIHPYELSYYNALIGGPRGAWRAGFELAYWYDAYNPQVLAEINARAATLPAGSSITFGSSQSAPSTFDELQALGELRGEVRLGARSRDTFPYMWLLTHDSKASALTRLLFVMHPWYESRPHQLGGLRVAEVVGPEAVSRAWALQLLTDAPDRTPARAPLAPAWIRRGAPWLARLWGDGLTRARPLSVNESIFAWAARDPNMLRDAARAVAERRDSPQARRLLAILTRYDKPKEGHSASETLLRSRPQALPEAVEMLIRRPDAIRRVLTRYSYTDPASIGGDLDDGIRPPQPEHRQ
jgi:hypothetical protein